MNFKINNDQDGFNSYISQDEFFNQGGGLGTTSLAGGFGSIPRPSFAPIKGGRPRPLSRPSIPYHTHSIETGGPNIPRTLGPKPLPRPIPRPIPRPVGTGGLTPRPIGGGFISGMFKNASGVTGPNLPIAPPSPPSPPSNGCPCVYPPISGCTNSGANNYNPNAVVDDGSCTYSGVCYPQGCVSPGISLPGSGYNNLTSQGCSSLGNYQNTPASCGSLPGQGGPTRNFSGYSNFNQQGFGGYNDQMWFND